MNNWDQAMTMTMATAGSRAAMTNPSQPQQKCDYCQFQLQHRACAKNLHEKLAIIEKTYRNVLTVE